LILSKRGSSCVKSYRRALSGGIISEPKTKRGRRTIPLGEAAIAALQSQRKRTLQLKLRALEWEDLNLVFPNSFGRYLRADKVLVAFKRCVELACPRSDCTIFGIPTRPTCTPLMSTLVPSKSCSAIRDWT
jgi:hypothetical protein